MIPITLLIFFLVLRAQAKDSFSKKVLAWIYLPLICGMLTVETCMHYIDKRKDMNRQYSSEAYLYESQLNWRPGYRSSYYSRIAESHPHTKVITWANVIFGTEPKDTGSPRKPIPVYKFEPRSSSMFHDTLGWGTSKKTSYYSDTLMPL